MAEEPESICEWLDVDLARLSGDDKKAFIDEILATMSATEIKVVRTSAESLWERKFAEERLANMEGLRKRISELADSVNESIEQETPRRPQRKSRIPSHVLYRTPDGRAQWRGRGRMPNRFQELIDAGHNIEEYRVRDESEN